MASWGSRNRFRLATLSEMRVYPACLLNHHPSNAALVARMSAVTV